MLQAPRSKPLGCYFCFTEAEKTRANMLIPNTAKVRIDRSHHHVVAGSNIRCGRKKAALSRIRKSASQAPF
jgi:hypothetical protein